MKNSLYLVGGTALTMNANLDVVEDAIIEVVDGKIEKITSGKNFRTPSGAKVIDTKNCLVLPGLVNTHTHVAMNLFRGVADDMPLHQWLFDKIFPLERQFCSDEFAYCGTTLAAAEMIRSGVTTFNDMYYYMSSCAKAADDAGLRMMAGQAIIDVSNVEDSADKFIEEYDRIREQLDSYPLVRATMGPHSVYAVVKESTWDAIFAYADKHDLLLHLHLAETEKEEADAKEKFGMSSTAWFNKVGLWKHKVIAAHAIYLSDEDIEILAKHKVGVAHNPESNLKLGNAICKVDKMRALGMAVGLGTDSVASNNNLDLLQEADTAAKLQCLQAGVGKVKAVDVVQMLTCDGARALGLEQEIGSLEKGKQADIIAVDLNKAHATPIYNYYSHLIYSAMGSDVKHTMVAGKILMENYQLKTIQEADLFSEVKKWETKIKAAL